MESSKTDAEHVTTPPESEPPKYSNKQQLLFLAGAMAFLALLFLSGIFSRLHHWRELDEEAAKKSISPVWTLLELVSSRAPIDLTLPSTTQAHRETPIWARVDGYIKDFYADIGDFVEEGQLLLELEVPEIEKQISHGTADVWTLLARKEIAEITAKRWKDLFEANAEAVSLQEVEEKQATFKSAQAELEAAKANLGRLEKIHGFSKLYAPFKGIITQRNIEKGTLVTAGSQETYQKLFQIAKNDIIRVFVNVPQPYFRLIKDGGEADVIIQEFPDKKFKGIIARTSRALDSSSRTLLAEIHVDNQEERLITGLYATVQFHLIPETPYFIIPTTSLIIREGYPHVAVVDGEGNVSLSRVQIGRDFGRSVEIISGLSQGQKIITNPSDQIYGNMKIDLSHTAQAIQP